MPTYRFVLRRGDTAKVAADVPMAGELLLNTDNRTITVGDGATAGGLALHKASVGLGNVDNTSDADKPVSTAQAAALALKAPLASPAFTGAPTCPAPTTETGVANKSYVDAAVVAGGGGGGSGLAALDKTGLAHWWELPWIRSAYTDAADLTPNGTLALAAGYYPGRLAAAFSNAYYTKESAASLQLGSTSFTVEFWVMVTTVSQAEQELIGKWNYPADREWFVYLALNRFRFNLGNTDSSAITNVEASTVNVEANRWYHFAAVWDVSATQARIYIDGALSGSVTLSHGIRSGAAKFYVGTVGVGSAIYSDGFIRGSISRISIWHRALTTTEISQLATANGARYF